MSKRTKVFGGAAIALVTVLAAAGALAWYQFFRDDAPPKVTLAGALDSLAGASPSASPAGSATATESPTDDVVSAPAGGLDGTWSVDNGLESFVGYRVVEELVNIGTATAVGRTPGVTGTIVIEGNTVTTATVEADMTRLKSDDDRRDGQLRRQGVETGTYPTSTFELTEPIELPEGLGDGVPFSVTLTGNFTLHGVTKQVSVPAEAQLSGENLVVVGALGVVFADYGIEKPTGMAVLSIEDSGVMELQLFLKRG